MFLDPSPLAIALAIILSTSPHVLAAPHRRHHNTLLGRANNDIYDYDQQYEHGPVHMATLPLPTPPVTVQSVKTITVFPTPVRTPMPSNMQFLPPPGMPMPNGTRKPVEMKSSSSSSSSLQATQAASSSACCGSSSSSLQATQAAVASSSSASIIVVALPSSSLTITVPHATSATIPSVATPTPSLASVGGIEDNAASEILSVLSADLEQTATTVATTITSGTSDTDSGSDSGDNKNATQSGADKDTNSTQQSTAKVTKPTCSLGTTRKCCSAVHNNLKNVASSLGGITGFNLNFLADDTSVGLDCVDIDDNDSTEDGATCWDVVSCCETNAITNLGSTFVGCVPVV